MAEQQERNEPAGKAFIGCAPATPALGGCTSAAPALGGCTSSGCASDDPTHAEDERFMRLAIEQARLAAQADEVPIGAVVVKDGEVLAAAHNRRETDADPAAHAEFLAVEEASRVLDAWRLTGCTVYVTLEPCIMCAGLLHQARIDRCVYGAPDPKAGALGTLYAVHADERLNHRFEAQPGVCEEECAALLRAFFAAKRAARKEQRQADRACDSTERASE